MLHDLENHILDLLDLLNAEARAFRSELVPFGDQRARAPRGARRHVRIARSIQGRADAGIVHESHDSRERAHLKGSFGCSLSIDAGESLDSADAPSDACGA